MIRIFLCCSAGMSTSMLVKKMEQAAAERNLEVEIAAFSMADFDAAKLNKRVEAIEPMTYGMMKGEVALDQALSLLELA